MLSDWKWGLIVTSVALLATVNSWAAELPPELQAVKQQIITIASANTTNTENIPAVRQQLEPLIAQLEAWFIANRPENEVELTQVPWKNLWYDDPDIAFAIDLGILKLEQPRDRIFQVVEDGYYYNVSEFVITLFDQSLKLQNYLKGEYTIIDPAGPETVGQSRRNVIALEFVFNGVWFGTVPRSLPLSWLVQAVDAKLLPTIPIFGPYGVTGRLWNRYVDDDLRIGAGFNTDAPETIDLYLLRRVVTAE
ncbi:MAG TPA: hypothetical protein VFG20_00555 [Planctomycetaceae bacterium]|nr:hypothetical protein [Planctomycetaceae bacterium]